MNPTVDSMMSAIGFKRCACKDCGFHSPSVAYPMVRCNLLGEYVAPTFVCEEFNGGKS